MIELLAQTALLLQTSFPDATTQAVQAGWTTGQGIVWQQAAGISVFISLLLVSLSYMLSVLFDLPELKKWAKAESLQAGASAMLIFGLIAFSGLVSEKISNVTLELSGLNQYLLALPPGTIDKQNPFSLSHFYITSTINCLKRIYVNVFWIDAILVEPLESIVISVAGFHTISMWPLSIFSGMFHNITKTATWLLIANYFQRHLLYFISGTMMQLFLPLGVVLRVLPYTRGAGAFLMGLSIGLYFVYPFSYALIMSVGAQHDVMSCIPDQASELSEQCSSEQGMGMLKFYWKKYSGKVIDYAQKSNSLLAFMMMEAFIYPLVVLTITFTAIKQLSDIFGANVAELGQGLVRLI